MSAGAGAAIWANQAMAFIPPYIVGQTLSEPGQLRSNFKIFFGGARPQKIKEGRSSEKGRRKDQETAGQHDCRANVAPCQLREIGISQKWADVRPPRPQGREGAVESRDSSSHYYARGGVSVRRILRPWHSALATGLPTKDERW